MYRISHHYLTVGDDGHAVVEGEERIVDDYHKITEVVAAMIDAPGGRSGTTISMTVELQGYATL